MGADRSRRGWLLGGLLAVTVLGSAAAGCGVVSRSAAPAPEGQAPAAQDAGGAGAPPAPAAPPAPDPASVRANELGVVPVIMYHMLLPAPKGIYDRTPADYRAELERLATEGYVPVLASAYARGEIDVPAGKSPVVLTFDDSTTSQLTLGPDGQPLPETAVGILLDVANRHPGFNPVGTFFVNGDPFAEPGGTKTLRWLHDHGFEVANHTVNHANLRTLTDAKVQQELADNVATIRAAVPEAKVETLALPLGISPTRRELAVRGSSGGRSYEHRAVFLVGYKPARSPFDREYDPAAVPRIRSQGAKGDEAQFGSTGWLDQLARKPGERYVSDGDPATVSFPRAQAGELAPEYAGKARAY